MKKTTLLDVFLILTIGLLSLTWFRGNNIINVGDFGFPLSRISFFYKTLFFWDHSVSMGYPAPGQLSFLMPYSLLAVLTKGIGMSLVGFEKLLFYFWFIFSGLSMYYLCSVLKLKRIAKLSASLFYMMNPYSLEIIWYFASGLLLPGYILTPLILGLFIKSLNSGKSIRYVVLLAVIWFFAGTYAYANPAVAIVHWAIIFSYFLYYLLINRRNRRFCKQAVCKMTALLFLWVSFNIFWLFPYLNIIYQQRASVSNPSLGFISNLATFKLNSANLLGALRLGGLWSLHGKWDGIPYYIWADKYSTISFILISFLIPLFVFLPVFLINKKNKERSKSILYFVILAIIGIFLVKGTKSPLGMVNIWLYKYIPFLGTAFRANIQKWSLVTSLAFAPLLGLGINITFDYLKTAFRRKISLIFISFVTILLFFIYASPFWSGQLIFAGGGPIPSARIKVPSEYYNLKDWTNSYKNEWRLFSFPLSKNSNTIYKWQDNNGYVGGDIIRWFSSKPVIYANSGALYQIPILIATNVEMGSDADVKLWKLFPLLNVKYLLVHHDINWELIKNHSWWINHSLGKIQRAIRLQNKIKFAKKFNKLYLYKISDKYFLPHIYSSDTPTIVAGNIDTLVPMTETKYLEGKPVLLFAQQKIGNSGQITEKNLKDMNNFVFEDSNGRDLAVELSQRIEVGGQESEFETENPGIYEVYLDPGNLVRDALPSLKIRVDGKELLQFDISGESYSKYLKIAQVEIKEPGKHLINIEYTNKDLKIILVSKEERERVGKLIRQRINVPGVEAAYIFSREGEFYVP